MHPVLRLYEDVLSSAENVVFRLPPLPRFVFVVHGSANIGDQAVSEGEAWQGEGANHGEAGQGRRHLLAVGACARRPGQHNRQCARHDDA